MKYPVLVPILVLTAGSAVAAENSGLATDSQSENPPEWRLYETSMSPTQYREACRQNQDLVLDYVKRYSKDTLASVGIPKAGINLMGTAAGLAAGQDARFYLNKSKLFALEVKDATGADRSLMFGIKVDW